jgi:hypothetical protein
MRSTCPALAIVAAALGGCAPDAGDPTSAPLLDLLIEPSPARLRLGEAVTVRTTSVLGDRRRVDSTEAAELSTTTAGVAWFDADGRLHGQGVGGTVLEARIGHRVSRATVEVVDDEPVALLTTPPSLVLAPQAELSVHALAGWRDGAVTDADAQVIWSSSDPRIVDIDALGVVRAGLPGTATLDATLGPRSAPPITVTVLDSGAAALAVEGGRALRNSLTLGISLDLLNLSDHTLPAFWVDLYVDADTPDVTRPGLAWWWVESLAPGEVRPLVTSVEVVEYVGEEPTHWFDVELDHDGTSGAQPTPTARVELDEVYLESGGLDVLPRVARAICTDDGLFVTLEVVNAGSRDATAFYVDAALDREPTDSVPGDTWAKVTGLAAGATARVGLFHASADCYRDGTTAGVAVDTFDDLLDYNRFNNTVTVAVERPRP